MTNATYTIPSWLRLGVPRSCRGQAVERSYGIDLQSGVAVRRTLDRGDRTETWAIARLLDEEMDALESYDAGGADDPPGVGNEYREVVAVREDADTCDRCGEVATHIDTGFSPAAQGMRHGGCGGMWIGSNRG